MSRQFVLLYRLLKTSRAYYAGIWRPMAFSNAKFALTSTAALSVAAATVSTAWCLDDSDIYHDDRPIPQRLQRFSNFASVEYNGVAYMTPQDLMDSLVLDAPRERVFRRVLSKERIEKMLRKTPLLQKGGRHLFRKLGHNGIISYAEYLFLLTLLTMAFTIFDDDENQMIDKEEFLKIRSIVVSPNKLCCEIEEEDYDETDCKRQDTTILLHLFGRDGTNQLNYEQFEMFYQNLQRELIEVEFNEFARGKDQISPVDFARLVLRYSFVSPEKREIYLKRVAGRVGDEFQGISLEEFEQFSRFLNNLEDFSRAVRLYASAQLDVSRKELYRAVKCSTGLELDPHLIDVLFNIFDSNNDGCLSYNEFLDIMNDRLHRGFKNQISKQKAVGWKPFRRCIVQELARKE